MAALVCPIINPTQLTQRPDRVGSRALQGFQLARMAVLHLFYRFRTHETRAGHYAKCNCVVDTPISAMASVVLVGVTAAAIAMPWEMDASGVL